jgi:hypothetical protein
VNRVAHDGLVEAEYPQGCSTVEPVWLARLNVPANLSGMSLIESEKG